MTGLVGFPCALFNQGSLLAFVRWSRLRSWHPDGHSILLPIVVLWIATQNVLQKVFLVIE